MATFLYTELVKFALEHTGKGPNALEEATGLMRLAQKLDFLVTQVASDASFMAEKWASYARDAKDGRVSTNTPLGYSTNNDVIVRAAQFEALREAFADPFYAMFGKGPVSMAKAMADATKGGAL